MRIGLVGVALLWACGGQGHGADAPDQRAAAGDGAAGAAIDEARDGGLSTEVDAEVDADSRDGDAGHGGVDADAAAGDGDAAAPRVPVVRAPAAPSCELSAELEPPAPDAAWQDALPPARSLSDSLDPPTRAPTPDVALLEGDRVLFISQDQRPPSNEGGQGLRAYLHDLSTRETRALSPELALRAGNQYFAGVTTDGARVLLDNAFPELPAHIPRISLLDVASGEHQPLPDWCGQTATMWPDFQPSPRRLSRDGSRLAHMDSGRLTICRFEAQTTDLVYSAWASSPNLVAVLAGGTEVAPARFAFTLHDLDGQRAQPFELQLPAGSLRQAHVADSGRVALRVIGDDDPMGHCGWSLVFDLDSDGPTNLLTPFELERYYAHLTPYGISDDGMRVLLTAVRSDGTWEVVVVDLEHDRWVIAATPAAPSDRCFGKAFSPDGDQVAIQCCDDDTNAGCETLIQTL
jgi:hypothetical protein